MHMFTTKKKTGKNDKTNHRGMCTSEFNGTWQTFDFIFVAEICAVFATHMHP